MKALLIYSILFSPSLFAENLQKFCLEKKGRILNWYKCPLSKVKLKIRTCEYRNAYNELEFVNGCSGPTGKYKDIFFKACLKHDLCYHHEPLSNGYSQKHCDSQFLNNLEDSCDSRAFDIENCKTRAKVLYYGLRIVGRAAFFCANDFGHYESEVFN